MDTLDKIVARYLHLHLKAMGYSAQIEVLGDNNLRIMLEASISVLDRLCRSHDEKLVVAKAMAAGWEVDLVCGQRTACVVENQLGLHTPEEQDVLSRLLRRLESDANEAISNCQVFRLEIRKAFSRDSREYRYGLGDGMWMAIREMEVSDFHSFWSMPDQELVKVFDQLADGSVNVSQMMTGIVDAQGNWLDRREECFMHSEASLLPALAV